MTHFFLEIMENLQIVKMKIVSHYVKYDSAAKNKLLRDKKYIYTILYDQIPKVIHVNLSNLPP